MDALAMEAYVTRGAVWYILSYVQIGKGSEGVLDADQGDTFKDPPVNLDYDLLLQAFHENIADAYKEFMEIGDIRGILVGGFAENGEANLRDDATFTGLLNAAKYLQRLAFVYRRVTGKTAVQKVSSIWPLTDFTSWKLCQRGSAATGAAYTAFKNDQNNAILAKIDALMLILQDNTLVKMLKDASFRDQLGGTNYIRDKFAAANIRGIDFFPLLRAATRIVSGYMRGASLGISANCYDTPNNNVTPVLPACGNTMSVDGNGVLQTSTVNGNPATVSTAIHAALSDSNYNLNFAIQVPQDLA
eukprot:Opistho-1_new@84241